MDKQPLTKILCVDDDEDILTIAKYSLEALSGVEVKYVKSGAEAIYTVLSFHPDLILLDNMMPEMDGIATLKAIRLLPKGSNIPIVFFTAKAQREEVDYYIQLGVMDVITKPFDPVKLASMIEQIWDKYQQSRPLN